MLLLAAAAHAQDCPKPDPAGQEAREKECRAAGGEWARFGVRDHLCGVYSCVPRTADGGKPCRGHGDCEYLCVSRKPGALGAEAAGECAAVRSAFGCHYHIGEGRIIGRVCVD